MSTASSHASPVPNPAQPRKRSWGTGLLTAFATTLNTMLHRAKTQQYPENSPSLPPRTRGVIALLEENCTACMLCARECPDWCIYIDSHKETVPPETPGGREKSTNVLDRFAIDFSLCMYCGICVEVCPFDALFWSPQFEYAEFDLASLTHEKERLGQWVATVPVPAGLDERAAPAKAVDQAQQKLSTAPPTPEVRRTDPGDTPSSTRATATDPLAGPATSAAARPTVEEKATLAPEAKPEAGESA